MVLGVDVSAWLSVLGLGALLGVGLNHYLNQRSVKKRRKEERDALLRLISIEIAHNSSFHAYWLITEPLHAASEELDSLTVDVWKSARVRLAQLIPTELTREEFDDLAGHYLRLQHLIAFGSSPFRRRQRYDERAANLLRRDIQRRLKELEASRQRANAVIKQYIELSDVERSA